MMMRPPTRWARAARESVFLYIPSLSDISVLTYAWHERSCRSCNGAGISGGGPWAEEQGQGREGASRRRRQPSACARHQRHRQWPSIMPVSIPTSFASISSSDCRVRVVCRDFECAFDCSSGGSEENGRGLESTYVGRGDLHQLSA